MVDRLLDKLDKYLPVANEEKLPIPTYNRVVVFGTRIDGVYEMAAGFQEFLNEAGLTHVSVIACRDTANILFSFYAGQYPDISLPKGVVALPEMRFYNQKTGRGYTVDTPFELIEELCTKHAVPFIKFTGTTSAEQLKNGLQKISALPKPC